MSEKEQLLPRPSATTSYYTPPPTRTWGEETGPRRYYLAVVDIEVRAEDVVKRSWTRLVQLLHGREFLAEFVATFLLIMFGNGSVAQAVLGNDSSLHDLTINMGYGFGVMLGAYVAIEVTGAHMNPAVTLAMALRGKTSWLKVLPYWIAQYMGAFFASVVIYGVYTDALHNYTCPNRTLPAHVTIPDTFKYPLCTGNIFATYPTIGVHLSLANGFLDQVVGTFLLVLGIWAICDSKSSEPKGGMKPLLLGLLIWAIGLSFGYNCGYAINPARDLSPRIFTWMAGWGKDVFVCPEPCSIRHWWWVPVVAPMVGAVIATLFYWFLIEAHHLPVQRALSLEPGSVNVPMDHRRQRYTQAGVIKRSGSPPFQ